MEVNTYYLELIFTEYFLAIEIAEKGHKIETLFLKKKDKKHQKKKLNSKFIRINTSQENYDSDYEAGRIQVFISRLIMKTK